jgi:hypothetical protein
MRNNIVKKIMTVVRPWLPVIDLFVWVCSVLMYKKITKKPFILNKWPLNTIGFLT